MEPVPILKMYVPKPRNRSNRVLASTMLQSVIPVMGIIGNYVMYLVARPDIKKNRAAGERWSTIAQRAESPERD